jgi:alkyl hydroperoxide reductase subunit AhpC
MTLRLGDIAPDFDARTTEGPLNFHSWIDKSWVVFFSHPKDFTPVCTTELGYVARMKSEFDRRGVKVIGLSADPVDDHGRWVEDIESTQGAKVGYPLIGDPELTVSRLYGMLPASGPGDNMTVRNVFIIGPDKRIKAILVYPAAVGRNFDEVLRIIDALQLAARHKVATPANWRQGEDVLIGGSVPEEEAKQLFPKGWKELRPYLRIIPQPKD